MITDTFDISVYDAYRYRICTDKLTLNVIKQAFAAYDNVFNPDGISWRAHQDDSVETALYAVAKRAKTSDFTLQMDNLRNGERYKIVIGAWGHKYVD